MLEDSETPAINWPELVHRFILALTSHRPYGLPSFFSKTVLCNAASNLGFAASNVKGMAALETQGKIARISGEHVLLN